MFSFLKRQFKTKTGKLAMGVIVGGLVDMVAMKTVGTGVSSMPMVGEAMSGMFGLDAGALAMGAMFLRDGAAKKGE